MPTSMHLEWYQWLAAIAAVISIVAGTVRLWSVFSRKPQEHSPPSISQRGKFNQNIIVNGGTGSPTVDVQTNIRRGQ